MTVKGVLRRQDGAFLIVFGGNGRLKLEDENRDYFLGRHSACDLIFESVQVSNRHCSITRVVQGSDPQVSLTLICDTSMNGTFVNGKLVGKGRHLPFFFFLQAWFSRTYCSSLMKIKSCVMQTTPTI